MKNKEKGKIKGKEKEKGIKDFQYTQFRWLLLS